MRNTFLTFFILLLLSSCGNKTDNAIQTSKVRKGTFSIEVVESGELFAVNSINITAPAMSWRYGLLKILKIVEDGKEVKTGDTVIIFDPSEVKKSITDAESEYEIAQAELESLITEQELKLNELEADLKTANISYEISKIELELSSYESEIKKKEIQLNLEKAELDLKKAAQIINNQKKINIEDINQKKIRIRQLENNLNEAEKTLKNLTVTSPANGIPILTKNWNSGNKWQVGDQTWSGSMMIDLPDLNKIKVITKINEVDISKIKLGQNAIIRIDAFSDTIFHGKVTQIANLAISKNENNHNIKVFPVEVLIEGSSKQLMPGMTVNVKINVSTIKDVLYIPLDALFKKDNKEFVYIKKGSAFDKRFVETGQTNNDFVIINKGVKEGNVIALIDPYAIKEKNNSKSKKE